MRTHVPGRRRSEGTFHQGFGAGRAREPQMRRIRLVWVAPPDAVQGLDAETEERFLEQDSIELGADCEFPGPSGSYKLLPEEIWRTMEPHDPAPTYLHESYRAVLEKWMSSLPDAVDEVAIVARVRDAVIQLVETRLAADPRAVSASMTVTTTEPTGQGIAVIGRCVLFVPAR
jgi:hypothetical protein